MKKKSRQQVTATAAPARVSLPKNALLRIQLGNSFAEYDQILGKPGVFVETPQVALASKDGGGCFFVGRRGTGKTAATLHLVKSLRLASQIHPQAFEFRGLKIDVEACRDTRQRPFRSLQLAFQRAILSEVLRQWVDHQLVKPSALHEHLSRERNFIDNYDFDARALAHLEEFEAAQAIDKEWLRLVRRVTQDIPDAFNDLASPSWSTALIFDRIDEAWDGSDQAVLLLMALMHACIELTTKCPTIRPKLFLRENIFERVRAIDNEFARLETFVVSMDWTQELLLELVERRLNVPFNTKLPLRGPTWDYFFETANGVSSRSMVFDYCQDRPRDVLTYCKFAIESAQSRKHEQVTIDDLQSARKRFSDSRLKDLGDEYAENYPQIQLVLARFFGLGTEFTLPGVESFIKKLLVDEEIKRHCSRWIFGHTTTDRFIHLLYNIGFFGLRESTAVHYRTVGAKSSTPPSLTATTHVVVHPSYHDALSLRDAVIGPLDGALALKQGAGVLEDLPDAISLTEYQERLKTAAENLKTLPTGDAHAQAFEDQVGEIIKLCFFRALCNVEPKSRDVEGRVVRDWMTANRAITGFWEIIRTRYGATQVPWECKNYTELSSSDFHQMNYYATAQIGRFVVCAFRGTELKPHYFEHIKRIATHADGNAMVLLVTEKDLQTFIRQAIAGKAKEDHIENIYDTIVRKIS